MKLAGVIYLHDIAQARMLGSTRRNLDMFRKLVGDKALDVVVLGTTKWGSVDESIARRRACRQLLERNERHRVPSCGD